MLNPSFPFNSKRRGIPDQMPNPPFQFNPKRRGGGENLNSIPVQSKMNGGSRSKCSIPLFPFHPKGRGGIQNDGGNHGLNAQSPFPIQSKMGGVIQDQIPNPLSHSIQSEVGRSWIQCHIPLPAQSQIG